MGKLTTYIIVMSGLMLLFYFTGLLPKNITANSTLLNLLLTPEGMPEGTTSAEVILVLEGITAIGIIAIGILTHNLELAVMGSFAMYLFNLLWDFLVVFDKVFSTNPVIAILLFSPLLLLYMVTILEWWRGRDVG